MPICIIIASMTVSKFLIINDENAVHQSWPVNNKRINIGGILWKPPAHTPGQCQCVISLKAAGHCRTGGGTNCGGLPLSLFDGHRGIVPAPIFCFALLCVLQYFAYSYDVAVFFWICLA